MKTDRQFSKLSFLLPRTGIERKVFVLVCLSAGFCEEVLFRGFLIRVFADRPYSLPIWIAVGFAILFFGMNHVYQGWKGLLSTAIAGAMFTILTLRFSTMVPAMALHALVDLRVLLLTLPDGHPLLNSPDLGATVG